MPVLFFQEEVRIDWGNEDTIRSWIIQTIRTELGQVEIGDISIIFCSDEYLLDINNRFLNHDFYTDIVTFEYDREPLSADLYLSIDRITENARDQEVELNRELYRVIIHGILHICGYQDKTENDQSRMRAREDHYLAFLSLPDKEI